MTQSLYDMAWLPDAEGARVQHIRSRACELFEQTLDQCEHGEQHCWNIEFALHHLIPEQSYNFLSEKERFFLLASPWILNIVWNQACNQSQRPTEEEYHTKACQYVKNPVNQKILNITSEEATIFESIIYFHRFNKRLEDCSTALPLGTQSIRVPLITAYLRLADAIHVDANIRGPSSLFYFLQDPSSPELFHWFKSKLHLLIQPDPKSDTIKVSVNGSIPSSEPLIQRVKEELELHVDAVRNTLVKGDVTRYLNVIVESREGPALTDEIKNEVDRLLKEYALSFPPNAGVLQDLYISSVQRIVKQNNINANVIIKEIEQIQAIARESQSFRPCHLAFARIINEVNKRLKANELDAIKVRTLERWADSTQRARQTRLETLSELGSQALQSFDHFLLFGFSNTIIDTLKKAFNDNAARQDIHIYVCEAHNKSRFDLIGRLMSVDGMNYARKLRAELPEAKVTLIPDVTVADVLNLKRTEGRWVALFGANGIAPEARCGHTSGHMTLAIIAKHFGIPVYILCDTYKMGNLQPKPLSERGEQWIKGVLHWRLGPTEGVKLQNLRESIIEPELINMIITEDGVFTTAQFIDKYSS